MPDTDVGTTTDFQPDEHVLADPSARFANGGEPCTFPGHGGTTPVEGRIVRGPDYQRDYLVAIEGNRYWVGEQYLSRPSPVTMTATPTVGQQYMLAPDATTTSGGRVYFGNTEPLLVTMVAPAYEESGSVSVTGIDADGAETAQWVDSRFLTPVTPEPEPEVIAEHGTSPEWPVYLCESGHGYGTDPHYHVIRSDRDEFTLDGGGVVMWNGTVHHEGTGRQRSRTEQGRRYGTAAAVAAWAATHPVPPLSQPCDTEPTNSDDLPPEEIVRIIAGDPALREQYATQVNEIESLLVQLTEARTAVADARHERALWLDRLIVRSREVAREQEWCGVYDAGMRELGLPDRHTDWNGVTPGDDDDEEDDEPETETITVTATIEVSVNFDDNDFDAWFEDRHGESISSSNNSTDFTFTTEVEHEVEVTEGECGCDEDIDWENVLPSYIRDHGYSWDIERRSCSND
jgi:hypothetical protein